MTHKKISKLAGVSPSTVSKALAGSKEVSIETILAVRKIAEENGYFYEKKERKKRSVKHVSPTVAVLCPEIISPYYASIITHLQCEIRKFGGKTAVYICGFDGKVITEYIRSLAREEHIDAIVCFSAEVYEGTLPIPLLYMQHIAKTARYDAVFCNIYDAIEKAVLYLKELGHTKIGFIGETNTFEKLDAFKHAMASSEIPLQEDYIYVVEKRFEEIGYEAVRLMLQSRHLPTAFVTAYDEVALGAIRDLKSAGISVPRDISFIGINDVPFSSYVETPLTTIRSHIEEQCAIAANLLKQKMFDPDYKAVQHIMVQSDLMIRQTTAKRNPI